MIKKSRFFIPFLLFLISLGVYLKTLCPTVYVGDSGELIAAAHTLGIPHPPGYPLYCLLGRLFTFLPFGSIAYRVNLMSAFFASLTVVLVYLIVLKIQINGSTGQRVNESTGKLANWQTGKPFARHIPAISASLLFAFSRSFWSQAVIAEVYTLNAFFLALSIFVLLKWRKAYDLRPATRDPRPATCNRYLYLFSLIYGLSLTHHYIMGLFAPAFILFILWSKPKIIKEVKTLFFMLGLFLLPLIVYLYLPLRSLTNPPLDWGNPENWPNFLAHIARFQFRNLEFVKEIPLKDKGLFIFDFLRRLSRQFTPFLSWLGLVGIWRILKKDKRFFSLSLLIFLVNSLGLIFLLHFFYNPGSSFVFSCYYLPAYLIFSLWMGYGIGYLLKKGEKVNKRINFGGKSIYRYVAPLLILFLPLLLLSRNYFYNDRSSHYIAYDYGMNILRTLDEDAILFTQGDNSIFVLAYLTLVEAMRPDVTIYARSGNLFPDVYGFSRLKRMKPLGPSKLIKLTEKKKDALRSTIEKRIITTSGRPIYYTAQRKMNEMSGYTLEQVGFIYRVSREGDAPPKEVLGIWRNYNLRGMDEGIFKDYMSREIIAQYHYCLGKYYGQIDEPEKALQEYEKASRVGWDIKEVHYNLGLLYEEERLYDQAIRKYERAIECDPAFALAHNNLGVLYAKRATYNKAGEAFRKAILLDPGLVKAYNNLGNVYGSQGKYGEAREMWEKALKLDPNNRIVQANLKRLERMGY